MHVVLDFIGNAV